MPRRKSQLTVLSFGGGQDSTAILYLLAEQPEFRQFYAPNDLLVLFSDTGDEFPMTYLHLLLVEKYCREREIEFVHIRPQMGFHSETWPSLTGHFEIYHTVMAKHFVKACTDNLKIQPIYRYLSHFVAERYGRPLWGPIYKNKNSLVDFALAEGKIRMLLGIAKGEEGRIASSSEVKSQWMRLAVLREYPLVRLGWDRAACQDYIRSLGRMVPVPSNCMRCPFADKVELLYLARKFPKEWAEWVRFEAQKLRKFARLGERNYGVLHKTKRLPQVLADAERVYGHLSVEELERHRFHHGHCVRSRY